MGLSDAGGLRATFSRWAGPDRMTDGCCCWIVGQDTEVVYLNDELTMSSG